jgi:hemolysin III
MRSAVVTTGRAGGAGAVGAGDGRAGLGGASAAPPRLRGMLHAGALPAAAVAGVTLTALGPTLPARLAAAVYSLACMAMFGVSAAYHRSPLASTRRRVLSRLDHVGILLVIAGTYTPLAVLALRGWTQFSVLVVIWTTTAVGAVARLTWRSAWRRAPRWLSTSFFIALGWLAVLILPQLLHGAGALAMALVVAGGILYSLGAIVYARRRPDPSPRWFGFHEVFHAITILAYLTQYAAVSLVVYRAALSQGSRVRVAGLRSARLAHPASRIVSSKSLRKTRSTCLTPSSPARPSP